MTTNKQMVPELRFKGFTDSWEKREFSEIVARQTKTDDAPDLPRVEFENIISGEGRLNKDLAGKNDNRKGTIFEPNDVLFGKLRPYLKNWLFTEFKGIALGDFWVLRARKFNSPIFIYALIQSTKFQTVANLSSGTKMPRSDWKTVTSTEFSIPSDVNEQDSIGRLFKQLDNLIAVNQRKVELLKTLKKAYLQQLFPEDGSTTPRLRFAGFTDAWEKRPIKKIATVNGGKDYKHLNKGDIPVYGTGGYMLSVDQALSEADGIGIGRKGTINSPYILRAPYWTVDTLFYVIPKGTQDLNFLYAIFKRINWKKYDESTGVPSLSKQAINAVEVTTPTQAEQELIGTMFKHLDTLIAVNQRKVELLKKLKQAYLQKMFV